MARIMGTPGRYIQGYDELANIEKYIKEYANSFLFVIDKFLYADLSKKLKTVLAKYNTVFEQFGGECSENEISRLVKVYKEKKSKMVIGIGSGKTIDTAKSVAYEADCPVVICPSAASCDAPCSSLAVVYHDDGTFHHYYFFKKNPDIVLVDSKVCSEAPVRLLVAGMGDALATYFEARATAQGGKQNFFKGQPTKAGITLARVCYDTLLADGYKAKLAVEKKLCTPAVENIIEANILLSGLGFESGGLACAHSVYDALTIVPEAEKYLHGEKVAFGTLTQLILENAPSEEIDEVLDFCMSVGLPVCLNDIGIKKMDRDILMKVAEKACDPAETMGNLPFSVTPLQVCDAMIAADAYGKAFKCMWNDCDECCESKDEKENCCSSSKCC